MMATFMSLEDAAREAAGNWKKFECFVWFREQDIEDPDNWAIIYTHNRDSGLLDQSNAEQIAEAMTPFTEGNDPDVVMESHNHWGCGHIDGFSIRVFRGGQITDAFKTYHDLAEQLADYPVLNEEDYSRREYEATLENIEENRPRDLVNELPDDWVTRVYTWLWDNTNALENTDDRGGWAEENEIMEALYALGLEPHPGTYPLDGDLLTVDGLSFHIMGLEKEGPVVWAHEGDDVKQLLRDYLEDEDLKVWKVFEKGRYERIELR